MGLGPASTGAGAVAAARRNGPDGPGGAVEGAGRVGVPTGPGARTTMRAGGTGAAGLGAVRTTRRSSRTMVWLVRGDGGTSRW